MAQTPRPFAAYEFMIAWRYLRARRAEGGVSVMTWISLIGLTLAVFALIAPLAVRAGFRAPRKQIHNSLSQGIWLPSDGARPWLEACDIDPVRRAATLTLEEWARLAWERERAGAPAPPEARDVVG